MNKHFLDRYFKTLSKKLLCDKNNKQRFLSDLRINAEHWLELHPSADETAFLSTFGSPDSVAESYLEQMDASDVARKIHLRRRILKIIGAFAAIIAVIISATIIWTAINENTQNEPSISLPAEYAAQIGAPKAVALENLGLTEEDLTEVTLGLYKIPRTVSYSGYNFEIHLIIDIVHDYLYGFEYRLETADPTCFAKLNNGLVALYGDPYHLGINAESLDQLDQAKLPVIGDNVWAIREYQPEDLNEYQSLLLTDPGADKITKGNLALLLDLQFICSSPDQCCVSMRYYMSIK